ncbi:putative ORFan [Tupanvirus deep ocean]|uniref:ORFan n=2 Tax=Tupanvirus TaxID=2094720 RepID=A0AC62A722_9VIRU|nr:putative ORFan [Tupanvirus deep ocean]QKU33495.1 putative ORFan [Tupanvirus deep ocean]
MDCCVARTRVNFGTWYCPKGKTPQEFTYCEYCYNNGCANKSEVYAIEPTPFDESKNNTSSVNNCNCDCPKQAEHPFLVQLLCPVCDIGSYGMCRCCICGQCSRCQEMTAYSGQIYCSGCSYFMKACHECGEPIKDGNSYVIEIENLVKERVDRENELLKTDRFKGYKSYVEENINHFNQELQNAKHTYTNKTSNEMIKLLSDKMRSKYSDGYQ